MAIFHFSAKVIGRSSGRSAVAAAAYRAGEQLHDQRIDRTHDFTNKAGVLHSEVMLPKGAAEAFADRATLWNAVEAAETRKDAQLAREVEFALPRELSKKDNIKLAREFVKAEFVEKGMIADLNVHWDIGEDGKAKPHAHVMLTMREVTKDNFGAKVRDWNKTALIEQWRERWADHVNRALAERDIDARIDHRSLEAQGIALEPQDKIGPAASRIGGRGLEAERIEEHHAIAQRNGERIIANPALALDAITHQKATFTRRDLAAFVHRHSDGKEQFDTVYNAVRASPDLISLGKDGRGQDRFTSRAMIETEQRLHRAADTMAQRAKHSVSDVQRNAAFAGAAARGLVLTGEQKSAFEHVTNSKGLAVVVGYAGTGKSAMLGVAREAWESAGYAVRGAALSGIAAEGLENGSGIASRTIASLEHQWGKGREHLTGRDVLVIDEAGMVGTRQMERVLSHAANAGAKVVLVGDQQQLQAIEAGAAFRAIHERHGGVEISEVRRQLSAWQQDATEQLATGRTGEAIRTYEERGMVHAADTREIARTDLIERWNEERQTSPGDSRIILTHTNDEVRELNQMARGKMREAGALGADAMIKAARGERLFASGDRIIFLRNERGLGVKNGTLGTVAMASAQSMAVRTDDGREIAFDTKDYADIDHGYAATIHKAQGMTVNRTHVLATPGMDSHSAYVTMSRHREGLALHYGRDDFADQSKLVRTLSRERGKDMAGDYQPEQAFAELRGISFRERIMDMVRQVPERAKSIFGNFRPQARQLEPIPAQANTQNDQRRAVERYARALGDIGTMQSQGLPVLPHQKDALEQAGKALDAIRPHAATDLAKALDRHPELIAKTAGGRSQEAMRAMSQEAAVRTDPALRSERFVSDWQGLSTARKQLEQQGDRAGAARMSAEQNELIKGLGRDPQSKACCAARPANSTSIRSPNAASPMNSPQPSPASAPVLSIWAFRRNDMEDDHIEEVQLDLEVEAPPAPDPEPDRGAVEESDPATEAFARLEGEMAMVRHTVQNMARERADIVIPDYTATLSKMANQLEQVSDRLAAIGSKPAIELTPEDIAVQIKRTSNDMQRDTSDLFRQGRRDFDSATAQLNAMVGRVRSEAEQKRQTWRFAGMTLAAGILLWSILPGTIARAVPESWHWPEWMAERALGDSSRWNAGSRMMQSADPQAWHVLVAAADMQRDNRDKIEDCRKRANSSGKHISCTLQIRAQNGDD